MATKPSAGALFEKVAFDEMGEGNPDSPADYGNTVTDWQEQFRVRAAYIHLRGGEAVLAGRLEGRHVQVIRVRASSQTRLISTDWRARDVRTGEAFNVRDVTPSDDRMWLDILAESGIAQ
jgi:head-tail adaptor